MEYRKRLSEFQLKKHIANIITLGRIIFSLALVFISFTSIWFYIFYLFCGLSDMIDGVIARKTGAESKFGAKLDTVSDFVFMLVCGVKILPRVCIPVWLWVWMILIALVKMFNILLVFIRNRKLISIHSVLNKITGFVLFVLPLTLTFIEPTYSFATVSLLATIASIQEVYFVLKGRESL